MQKEAGFAKNKEKIRTFWLGFNGGRYKTRTCDLPHVKRMRYQLRQSSIALSAWSFYSIPFPLSSPFFKTPRSAEPLAVNIM